MVRGKWEEAFADERWERMNRAGSNVTKTHPTNPSDEYLAYIDELGRESRAFWRRIHTEVLVYRLALFGVSAAALFGLAMLLFGCADGRPKTQDAPAQAISKKVSAQTPDRIPPKKNAYEEPKWNWKRSNAIQPKPASRVQPHERIWAARRH
ncbi:MAG: hypothetical protein WC350_04780 [Candidatus Micrarchaeia archaeon]